MERTYIVKQEKGSNIWDAAYKVAEVMFKDPDIDFADRNGWSDADIFDISLTDRYWEVRVTRERSRREEADYKFTMSNSDEDLWASLKEVYMIM